MKTVWLVLDMERYDTRDSEEPRIAAAFTDQDAALKTRKLLEQREHPGTHLGYAYHFDLRELTVHESAFTENDIARGCADEITPPPLQAARSSE